MSEMDTPRTDEISRGYLSVPVEWAKTLERELAEAREELKKASQYIATGRSWNAPDSLLAEINTLQRELARATAERDELVAKYRIHHDEAERLTRETAEAREQIKNLNVMITAALNSANASHFRAMEYQSQRDTLAEALRKCVLWAECMSMRCERDRDNINWSYLNDAREVLAAVKGGSNE